MKLATQKICLGFLAGVSNALWTITFWNLSICVKHLFFLLCIVIVSRFYHYSSFTKSFTIEFQELEFQKLSEAAFENAKLIRMQTWEC